MRVQLRWIFWVSLILSLLVYAAMVLWSLPTIQQEAGGLRPFDLRPGGYSVAEASEFLTKLSEPGRTFYLTVQHRLDLVYPPLLAITLAGGILVLAPPSWKAGRWLLALLPLPGMIFDYLENSLVAALLRASPASLDQELVAAASLATVLKSVATSLAMTALLVLLVVRVWRKRRGKA